jgi:hypothetical protein
MASSAAGSPEPPSTPTETNSDRWKLGIPVVLIGVGGLVIAFFGVVAFWRDSNGVASLGIVASPIAAIVGAYFGIQMSSSAAKDANARAADAEDKKTKAMADVGTVLGHLPADQAERIRPTLNMR